MKSKLLNIEFVELSNFKVVGKEIIANMKDSANKLPIFWGKCIEENIFNPLFQMKDYVNSGDCVGYMDNYNEETGEFSYIVGLMMKENTKVPEGYAFRDVKGGKIAIGYVEGTIENGEIYIESMDLTMKSMSENGYVYDDSKGYSMEVYNQERFVKNSENGPNVILDYYIPCIKVEEK